MVETKDDDRIRDNESELLKKFPKYRLENKHIRGDILKQCLWRRWVTHVHFLY